jgi:hypothetical protein
MLKASSLVRDVCWRWRNGLLGNIIRLCRCSIDGEPEQPAVADSSTQSVIQELHSRAHQDLPIKSSKTPFE